MMNFSHMNAKQVHPLRFYFGLLIVILSRKEEYKQELSLKQTILLPSINALLQIDYSKI